MPGSANHDTQVFEKPESFAPGRPDARRHMTFGRGPRSRVGASLARVEAKVAFEVLAKRLPCMRLATRKLAFAENANFRFRSRR